MKREGRQLRLQDGLFLCVAIFSLLFLMAIEGKAADPSADYPSRPIEVVTHSAPGSTNDVMARLISDIIQKEKILSQPLVVGNKQGSGGAVAQGYVFEKKGNPHIILVTGIGVIICTPLLEKFPYNYKSFTPIANMVADGSILVVRSDSPFKTADDIIAEARKRPKELLQGGASFTSPESIMGRSMQKVKGVQWNFISFKSEPEAMINVLSGNVHFAVINPSQGLDHVRVGKLRVLLTAAPNRYPEFKDVPTMKEAGMGEPIITSRGILGPPNMPDYAVNKLEAAFKKVIENDRFKKYIGDVMMQPFWLSSAEYSTYLDKQNDLWKEWLGELDLLKK